MTVAPGNDDWRFEWLTTWDEVWDPSFVSQWEGWMDASPDAHVFFHPALVRAWTETYRALRRIEPRFLIARRGEDCTAFFPLVLDRCGWKNAWLRVIRPVGYNEFDYHDPILHGDPSRETWLGFWHALGEEIMAREDCDVLSVPRAREPCTGQGEGLSATEGAPYILLARFRDFDDFLRGLGSKHRQDIRRKQRELEKLGALRIHIFRKDELAGASRAVERFLEAHRARWPNAYRPEGFLQRLVERCLPEGLLHLSVLESAGRPISWDMDFLHGRHLYCYVWAYEADMATYSPGKVHFANLIEAVMARGISHLYLGRGLEPYKLWWTKESVTLYALRMARRGLGPRFRLSARKILRQAASLVLRRPV